MRKFEREIKKAIASSIFGSLWSCKNGILQYKTGLKFYMSLEHRKNYDILRWAYYDKWDDEIEIISAIVGDIFCANYQNIHVAIKDTVMAIMRNANEFANE